MSLSLVIKAVVTFVLALILMIPIGAVREIVEERIKLRDGVVTNIQRTAVGTQRVVGPILVIPYQRTIRETTTSDGKTTTHTRTEDAQVRIVPSDLTVDASLRTEHRSRGIYSALLYHTAGTLNGSFAVPERYGLPGTDDRVVAYTFGQPFVALGISDTRGIKGKLVVRWDDGTGTKTHEFDGGTFLAIGAGVHATVGTIPPAARAYRFAIDLQLMGAASLEVVPVGKETTVKMRSPWPHPSFIGQFLPETRTVAASGFDATWRTSRLATNVEPALEACEGPCAQLLSTTLGVSFLEPVDVYLQAERSAKYGFLFILLTFVLFALFELLKRMAIHPVQYALVGVALAMFFLLLVALSEHLPFAVAYVAASASCILLLGFYVSYVLRGVRRGAGFAGLLTVLYGALYVLLRSEDMALVLGAILLFGIVAAIMVVTRRVDWYRITARPVEG